MYHIVKLTWTLVVFFTYNLQFYVAIQILWPPFLKRIHKPAYRRYGEWIFRTIIVLFTSALGLFVPCLEQLISFIGSFALASLSLCIPPILEIVCELPQKEIDEDELEHGIPLKNTNDISKQEHKFEEEDEPQNIYIVIIRGIILVVLGFGGAVSGCTVTILEIVHLLNTGGCA